MTRPAAGDGARSGPLRFGITVPTLGPLAKPEVMAGLAIRAETLGFHSLWALDHVVMPAGLVRAFGATAYEQLTTLTFLAGRTSRIRLGTSVLVLPYRNAVLTAKMLATLDALSGGRLILGIGAGHIEEEFAALGADFAARGRATDAAIDRILALWAGDGGEDEFRFLPRPVQHPRPPVLVGGVGRVAIERAVRVGDGWHPTTFLSNDEIAAGTADLRRRWRSEGRAGEPIVALGTPVRWEAAPRGRARPWAGVRVLSGTTADLAAGLSVLARWATLFVLHLRARSAADLLEQLDAMAGVIPLVEPPRS